MVSEVVHGAVTSTCKGNLQYILALCPASAATAALAMAMSPRGKEGGREVSAVRSSQVRPRLHGFTRSPGSWDQADQGKGRSRSISRDEFPFFFILPSWQLSPDRPRDRCPRVKRAAHVKQENQLASAPAAALPLSLCSLACLGSRSRVTTRKVGLEREECGREMHDKFREFAPISLMPYFFHYAPTPKRPSPHTQNGVDENERSEVLDRGSDDANERRGERQSSSQVGRAAGCKNFTVVVVLV